MMIIGDVVESRNCVYVVEKDVVLLDRREIDDNLLECQVLVIDE